MQRLRTLESQDTADAQRIVDLTYSMLEDIDLPHLAVPGIKTPDVIGVSGVCVEVSDVATRAAHALGIVASREHHGEPEELNHYITSFAPLDQLPTDEDPIMCLTWGQFDEGAYRSNPGYYFGSRKDICGQVNGYYHDAYSAESVFLRYIAHTAGRLPYTGHVWLETTPLEVAGGGCPVGEVARADFPPEMWEPEPEKNSAAPVLITS